ncbi:MAG: hypothetical protein ACRDRW_18665 [Pseudonocardiaceae bacterium]
MNTRWDPAQSAEHVVQAVGVRPVEAMAYATSWAARLVTDNGQAVFPAAHQWLRQHQHADGSWGSVIPQPHDRLVSTLAAVLALYDVQQAWAQRAVRAGVTYLRRHGRDWQGAPGETIGFEVVAPCLVEEATSWGLLSAEGFSELAALRCDKLSLIPTATLIHRPTPLLYSMEALANIAPLRMFAPHASLSGAMADNPAATAALWAATGDVAALSYLHEAAHSTGGAGMPETYPIDVFEPAWVLYVLHRAKLTPPNAKQHVERLAQLARKAGRGLGISESFPVPDSDDTAMVANVLNAYGHSDSSLLEALLSFETDTHFAGFPHERGAPVSANARILEALTRHSDQYAPQLAKILSFLLDTRQEGAWWTDKWHRSPHYATAQVAFALANTVPHELTGTWQWLLDSQHTHGAWGIAGGQPEETAYAVLALDSMEPHLGPAPADTYRHAHTYLRQHLNTPTYAELWVGKGLYTPATVVRAAILAACTLSDRKAAS